jgi:hypothetical protein
MIALSVLRRRLHAAERLIQDIEQKIGTLLVIAHRSRRLNP